MTELSQDTELSTELLLFGKMSQGETTIPYSPDNEDGDKDEDTDTVMAMAKAEEGEREEGGAARIEGPTHSPRRNCRTGTPQQTSTSGPPRARRKRPRPLLRCRQQRRIRPLHLRRRGRNIGRRGRRGRGRGERGTVRRPIPAAAANRRRRGGTRSLPNAASAADPRIRRGEGWNGKTATAGDEGGGKGTRKRTRDRGMRAGGPYCDSYIKEKGGHWGGGGRVGLGRLG